MPVYYNENDLRAASWLRELIKAGLIAAGDVDERSIENVQAQDLEGYTQCHFFAGIGGWSYALRLAGWPDDRPVWTGSCPCQPFSAAGQGKGFDDPRHLWPAWFRLLAQCRPGVVFGEQVASKAGLAWLDVVQADLEGAGYAVGAVDLCAAGVGAPHIRQRLWFVAKSLCAAGERGTGSILRTQTPVSGARQFNGHKPDGPANGCEAGVLGHAEHPRFQEQRGDAGVPCGAGGAVQGKAVERAGPPAFWSACDWLPCHDGKARPVEPGTFPLAHGLPARVGRLRGYGNAIVPQVAAEVIRAYVDSQL